MDELRDRIAEAIYRSRGYTEPLQEAAEQDLTVWHREAQAVIDALGLHHAEGEEIRKAKAEGWNRAINHVEIWIKFNLGKDTLFEFEEDDHPNPYEDDKEDG